MFGLDDMIANLSDGATFGIVMAVAVLLGLRHATDPDHLAAVTAVAAGSGDPGCRQSRATFGIVMAVAVLLGLRHATDPDHLAAVTAVAAGSGDQGGRQSARLGLAWGGGHALTLFVFGLPIVLFAAGCCGGHGGCSWRGVPAGNDATGRRRSSAS